MSESNEYKWLKANVFKSPARFERIENVLVAGTLDANYCIKGCEGWIEIKAPREPKREGTPLFGSNHKLSQEQANWILAQRRAGGRAFIWVGTDKRRILLPGMVADHLNEMTMAEILEAAWWSRPLGAQFDKQELIQCLMCR